MALYFTLEHLKYCLYTSRVDMKLCHPLKGLTFALLRFYLINYLEILIFLLTKPWKKIKRDFKG